MVLSNQITLWADQLRDISALGLKYATNIYDQERYTKIQRLVIEMLSSATNWTSKQLISSQDSFLTRPSPIMTGDAAIINEFGQILLIQRTDNQLWAMPGGLLEVGETPAEGVLREVLEETGLRCQTIGLVGIFDSRLCGTNHPLHLYHTVFLCKPLDVEAELPLHNHESLDKNWFDENSLPLDLDPSHENRIPEAFRIWHGDIKPFYDSHEF
ncbi:MAG: NUDIX hydrolase N-terminal domain-containing protein [Candidatus Hodarchaeales archaeon]|jgi:ADP-ribose pyrophosphatase YjhB (NUDIX family)